MVTEVPSITFDRVAGESAMVRQLLSLLIAHSPAALAALRALDVNDVRGNMEAGMASDVFIDQAINVLADVRARADAIAAGSSGTPG